MTNLKRSFFWAAFYLAFILILGQTDYAGKPIINFASYFYMAIMIAIPATLFFPAISKVPVYVPFLVWAVIYMVVLQSIDRTNSTTSIEFSIVVLEFILLEAGVWIAHQLAVQISYAESLMDALAFGAFPNRVHGIEAESQRIKVELTRSRRYQRPLSLLVIEVEPEVGMVALPTMKSIQTDLMSRFTFARVGQIIDDLIRQTDLFLKDRRGRHVILCSETNFSSVELLAKRISRTVEDKTGRRASWGIASFPDEALTFDDLLQKASDRLVNGRSLEDRSVLMDVEKDTSRL
jgi:hypothetical protein